MLCFELGEILSDKLSMYVHVSINLSSFAYGCIFFSFAMIVILA